MSAFTMEQVLEEFEEAQWPPWRLSSLWAWAQRQLQRARHWLKAPQGPHRTMRAWKKATPASPHRPPILVESVGAVQVSCPYCGGIIEHRPGALRPIHLGRCQT